jgi:hypothetical protein
VRTYLILAATLALSACAPPTIYQWGGYEQGLYASYKDPVQVESLRVKLETHIAQMEQSRQKVAPGLYAELGTLYLQAGGADKALAMYAKERDTWPESRGLMTAMIQNIERRQQAKLGEQK